MENINLPPFWIGQKVITTREFGRGEGKECVVKAIEPPIYCSRCEKQTWGVLVDIWEYALCQTCFAPIQENFQSISLEKILEKETELISSN